MTTQGQCNLLTFVQSHSDSTFSNFFPQKTLGCTFEAKFQMEPPWDVGMKICSNVLGHMTKMASGKTSFFGTKRPMTLKLGIQHRVLKCYHISSTDDTGWPWPFLWHSPICFLMLLHGWKLIQHIVMYFQACSNSAYPMHSGERYRTIGPLVYIELHI